MAFHDLTEVIVKAAQSWPSLSSSGDPNMVDVYWHAGQVTELMGLRLPSDMPPKDTGVDIVALVDSAFIPPDGLIRDVPPTIIAERGRRFVEAVESMQLLPLSAAVTYVVALYTWHGCLAMAKCLRRTYRTPWGEVQYTLELRRDGYESVMRDFRVEEEKGNPWVRYGVSLARLLEERRGNPIVDGWVPRDSPYWE